MTPDYKGPWVALYIKTIYGKTFNQLSCAERSVFLQGLFLAARVEYDCSYDGHFYHVLPGQFVVSQRGLAKQCGEGCSRQIVRDTISKLEADGTWTCLRTQSGPQSPSLITFMHWGLYQRPLKRTTQSRTHRTTQLQPTDSIQPLMNGGENDALPCSYNVDTQTRLEDIVEQKEKPLGPPPLETKIAKPKRKSKDTDPFVQEVLVYLNLKIGSKYSVAPDLVARFKQGATVDQAKAIIDKKVAEWAGTEMAPWLKPSTLFCKKHFDEYLNQPGVQLSGKLSVPIPIWTEEQDMKHKAQARKWLDDDKAKEDAR